jgi:hypothetical protein
MSENKTLDEFYGFFRGNRSFFIKHRPPFVEKEGKLVASRCGFALYDKRNPPPEGKKDGDYIPVTKELYRQHLNGGDGLAISPITDTEDEENVCYYAVIDIDVYGGVNFTWLVSRLYRAGFNFAPFLSKSGGLHIYFFFNDAEPAGEAVKALEKIVEVYGLDRLFVNKDNKSKVEIFPKQTKLAPGHVGSCLFLPFYNAANPDKCRAKMLTAEGGLLGITKALPVIGGMFTSVRGINSVLDNLPYNDAPYCVQMILLSGALWEGDFRDNFLCCVAIYFKKKSALNGEEADFLEDLREANNCLESPLEDADIERIYESITGKGYDKYWCNKPPCKDYCSKSLCKMREYGIGRTRNSVSTGADCWGEISKVMAAEPYYIWKVRVNSEDEYKEVRFDSEEDVLSQAVVQRCCMRYLHWIPTTIKKQIWEDIVRKSIEGMDKRQIAVPKGTDTTAMGELRGLFVRYLLRRRARNGQPCMVATDQVYYAEGEYYFTTGSVQAFLRYEKFSLGKINLHAALEDYGCSAAELRYKNAKGAEKVISCWKKPEDEELLEMSALYDDAHEADMEILQSIKPKKEQAEGGSDEGIKF